MKNVLDFRIGSRYPPSGSGLDLAFDGTIEKAKLIWRELSEEEIASYVCFP